MTGKPVCAVIGVGPGNGAAIARKFHREGYWVAPVARSAALIDVLSAELGDDARPYRADAADPASLQEALARTARELGDVDVLAYDAGSGVWGTIEENTAKRFEAAWRVNALGALVASVVLQYALREPAA